jgi:hypothetical protein
MKIPGDLQKEHTMNSEQLIMPAARRRQAGWAECGTNPAALHVALIIVVVVEIAAAQAARSEDSTTSPSASIPAARFEVPFLSILQLPLQEAV